jgi:hypothetical protein
MIRTLQSGHSETFLEASHEKPLLLTNSFNAIIKGLKQYFFIWGIKINFQEKNLKNMERHRENMARSGIMKSFDPIK